MKFQTLLFIAAITCAIPFTACAPAQAPVPTFAPTETPPPTVVSPSVTPTPSLSDLAISDPKMEKAFAGAETTLTRETDGNLSVMAAGYQGETRVENKYIIIPGSASLNLDIKDLFQRPSTIKAYTIDEQGKRTDTLLIWDAETLQWRVPYKFVPDVRFERVPEHPFIAEGDESIFIKSAGLYFRDHPPFTDEAVERYTQAADKIFEETGQHWRPNYLWFYHGNDIDTILLFSADHYLGKELYQNTATMKLSDLWVYQMINGRRIDTPLVVFLDPQDVREPQKDEFKIVRAAYHDGIDLSKIDFANMTEDEKNAFIRGWYSNWGELGDEGDGRTTRPDLVVWGDDRFKEDWPLYAELAALPGNDPMELGLLKAVKSQAEQGGWGTTYNYWVWHLGGLEQLPPEIQGMILSSGNGG